MRGEILWQDFITAFRPKKFRSLTREVLIEWRDLLTQRYIYIEPNRKRSTTENIIDIIYSEKNIGPKNEINYTSNPGKNIMNRWEGVGLLTRWQGGLNIQSFEEEYKK